MRSLSACKEKNLINIVKYYATKTFHFNVNTSDAVQLLRYTKISVRRKYSIGKTKIWHIILITNNYCNMNKI